MGGQLARNVSERESFYRQAKADLRETELAVLDGDYARAMTLAAIANAKATLALYDGNV